MSKDLRDFGVILHFLDAGGEINGTVTYDTGRVVDGGTGTISDVALEVVQLNTGFANEFISHIRQLSPVHAKSSFDLVIASEFERKSDDDEITLKEEIDGGTEDVELKFDWTFDKTTKLITLVRTPYDISFAAFVAHVAAVDKFLKDCAEIV